LFATICGYFGRHTLSIQDARIHTTRHGWALDSFIVLLPPHDKDYRSQAALVEHELARELGTEPAQPRTPAHNPWNRPSRRSRVFPIMPNVELQPDESSTSWRLSVTSSDRPGLLHGLAQVFVRHGVNLKMAKIMTLGDP